MKKSVFNLVFLSVLVFSCGSVDDYDKGISEYLNNKEDVCEDICRQLDKCYYTSPRFEIIYSG